MKGAIIGDIIGSAYEFNNIDTKDFPLFNRRSSFTDDTVMTCAVAKALLEPERDTSEVIQELGRRYPDAGYGARFICWVFADKPEPYNSYGNGSAMRVSPVGLLAKTKDEVKKLSARVTEVSHNHPEGMKGAECTAMCIFLARQGRSMEELRRFVEENYYTLEKTCEQYRIEQNRHHGQEICQISVPQALECFFESTSFEDCMRNCVSIGGDSDTIAAIAGGIAEAYFGVPEAIWETAKGYLTEELLEIVERLYRAADAGKRRNGDTAMQKHFIYSLSRRYPQLTLPIADDTRQSESYRSTVLRGALPEGEPEFSFSADDRFETVNTPAGEAEIVYLADRADFEHCIRALAYRCENREIPPTMGASTISGLINWEKIRAHKEAYLASGGEDWDGEFARFTADSSNYRDTLIVLSRGFYSALSPEETGFAEEEWLERSYAIRKHHELAHFVSRKLFPENKDAVRDEVLADMNGIIAALGHFDAELEGKLLGFRDGKYVYGRLENYVEEPELAGAAERVSAMLAWLGENCTGEQEPFEYLLKLEEERIFL